MSCNNQQSKLPDDLKNLEHVTIHASDTESENGIEFEKEAKFGDTKNVHLGRFTDVATDSDGNVYIADSDQSNIKVFKPNGDFLKTLGREGKGPGEFTNIQKILISDSSLYLYDDSQKRIVVFNIDSSEIEKTIKIATNKDNIPKLKEAYFSTFYPRDDGTFLTSFYTNSFPGDKKKWSKVVRNKLYYIMDNDGEIISDNLLEIKSGTRIFIPTGPITVDRETGLYPQSLVSVSNNGKIYSSWSNHFLVKVYSPQGRYQQAYYYPHERVLLTQKSANEQGLPEMVTDGMSNLDLPEYWPSIDQLFVDKKNRLWVSKIISDQSKREWYLLDADGNLLSKFIWPANKKVQMINRNHLYTLETDSQTGIQNIVRYKFNFTTKNS